MRNVKGVRGVVLYVGDLVYIETRPDSGGLSERYIMIYMGITINQFGSRHMFVFNNVFDPNENRWFIGDGAFNEMCNDGYFKVLCRMSECP